MYYTNRCSSRSLINTEETHFSRVHSVERTRREYGCCTAFSQIYIKPLGRATGSLVNSQIETTRDARREKKGVKVGKRGDQEW